MWVRYGATWSQACPHWPVCAICAGCARARGAPPGDLGLEVVAPFEEERALLRHQLVSRGFLVPLGAAGVENRPGVDLIADQILRGKSAGMTGRARRVQRRVVANGLSLSDDIREQARGEV